MRAFAACLTVVLGLGAFSVVACSSDATTTTPSGDAGEAGAPSSVPAGGGGATSTAGAPGAAEAGAAGAAACGYTSDSCTECLTGLCGAEVTACANDAACGGGIAPLRTCACDATSTIDQCETDFAKTGGDLAGALVTCFNDKCASACK